MEIRYCRWAMSVDATIARIKAFARQKRWSKSRLAVEAGMADTVLRRFDQPDWNPTVETLRRLEAMIPAGFRARSRRHFTSTQAQDDDAA
jgi:ribosome-binding protein aMBF1 (putative translation factor)